MYSKFGQFIDGKWQEAEKKETYDVINPATEEVIGKASKASSADVQKALKSAEKGLKVWSNTTPWQRSYVIRKIADLMRERKDVQNIDLMNLAGFCRNCLSKWFREEAEKKGIEISDPDSREMIYGMPYSEWKDKFQK